MERASWSRRRCWSTLSGFYQVVAGVLRADESAEENLRRLVFAHTRWTFDNPEVAPAILVLERAHGMTPFMSAGGAEAIEQSHQLYRELLFVLLDCLQVAESDVARLAELVILICDTVDRWHHGYSGVGSVRGTLEPLEEAQAFAWLSVRRLLGLAGRSGQRFPEQMQSAADGSVPVRLP